MNKPLKLTEVEPYRSIQESVQFRRHFVGSRMISAVRYHTPVAETTDDIALVFDAKENLRRARSTLLEPNAVKAESIRLAEQALLRQAGAAEPERIRMSIESVALDLSKILD